MDPYRHAQLRTCSFRETVETLDQTLGFTGARVGGAAPETNTCFDRFQAFRCFQDLIHGKSMWKAANHCGMQAAKLTKITI